MTNRHVTVNQAIARLAAIDPDALADLGRRIHAAIEIDDRNPSTPDGYPARTPGAAPRTRPAPPMAGQCRAVEAGVRCPEQRPCPQHDTAVPLTPVEAAATTRPPVDETTTLTRAAVNALVAAADAYELARTTIGVLETTRRHPLELSGHCEALAAAGGYEPAHRTTLLADPDAPDDPDRTTPVTLGRWAYDHLRRTTSIPTRVEALLRMTGKRVR